MKKVKDIFKLILMVLLFPFKMVFNFFKYNFKGFFFLSFIIYKFFKYVFFGMFYFVLLIFNSILGFFSLFSSNRKYKQDKKSREELAKKNARDKMLAENKRKKEEKIKAKKEKDMYINEKVHIEKKTFADRIDAFVIWLSKIPKKIITKFSNYYNNLDFVKQAKNKKDINREILLINFDGEDSVKTEIKQLYEYVAKDIDGKIIKGYFPAFSKVEVHSFLLAEGFEVYSIRTNQWIEMLHKPASGNGKIKTKDLIFFTTQLSTYIKAGMPLVDSLKILSRQYKNKNYQRIFKSMVYDLTMGESFSESLNKQGTTFPRLLINMVKASEMTGELPESLDDMANYFTESDATRRQMITAMMYPCIVSIVAIVVVAFILIWVIPQFATMYETMDADKIPEYTMWVLSASDFLKAYYLHFITVIILLIFINLYLYKNVKSLKTFAQYLAMHLPVFGKVIIYNEVTMFTKTFSSLLQHNVFITDTMDILNKVTNNEIYKILIADTITNLGKGSTISQAFKNHWAFPLPAYEMLVTGEKTGEMPEMMGKVSNYYQELQKQAVGNIKTFIEPALLLFLTVVVGGIVLAVIIPIFGTYSAVM
ncbi:MAG: type II secretion system F family protein [Mycoplasmatota bacterium]